MKYLLDANTYIQAKNLYYQMSFCPAYWQWLDAEFAQGNIASIDEVYNELVGYGDDLSEWAKARREQFLSIGDDQTQVKYVEVVQHVFELPNKNAANVANFLDKADPWLIAKASVLQAVVVTQESYDPPNSKKVKIPNVCRDFGVEYITTFQLLERLKAQFGLVVDA